MWFNTCFFGALQSSLRIALVVFILLIPVPIIYKLKKNRNWKVWQLDSVSPTVRRSCQQKHLCCSHQYCLVCCHQRHLWQTPVLSGFLLSETSLEREGGGRRKWEFTLSVPVELQELFTCRKILRYGTFGFISHPKGRCAADFYRPQKSDALARFEPANFGSSGKHSSHYTTKETIW
jgi:hypothetical protein